VALSHHSGLLQIFLLCSKGHVMSPRVSLTCICSASEMTYIVSRGALNSTHSLTCICCKIMEHIVCSHIRAHLDKYGILSKVQHGFRASHSCETQSCTISCLPGIGTSRLTQLSLTLVNKVPHKRLLSKLRYQCRQAPHANICPELTEISWMCVGASVFAQISVGKLQFSV